MATGDLPKKFCEDWSSSSRDMLADRQTHRQTDRQTDNNTPLPYWGGVKFTVFASDWKMDLQKEMGLSNLIQSIRVNQLTNHPKQTGLYQVQCSRLTQMDPWDIRDPTSWLCLCHEH